MDSLPLDAPQPRLCHLVKWQDFDGYGFNLHAEKAKCGQYVGKVDDASPASLAGLREGDRIVEVNSVNIANENHRQVVERIKSLPNETKLLVIDQPGDDWFKERKLVIKSTQSNVISSKTPSTRPQNGLKQEAKECELEANEDMIDCTVVSPKQQQQSSQNSTDNKMSTTTAGDVTSDAKQLPGPESVNVICFTKQANQMELDTTNNTANGQGSSDKLQATEEEEETKSAMLISNNNNNNDVKKVSGKTSPTDAIKVTAASASIGSSSSAQASPTPTKSVSSSEGSPTAAMKVTAAPASLGSSSSVPASPTSTKSASSSSGLPQASEGAVDLNLNMSVSQMRQLLAQKKKNDPKKAQMDLRQKYEIIQQM